MTANCIVFGNTKHSGKGITAEKEAVGYSVSLCEVINADESDGITFDAFDYNEADVLETYVKLHFVGKQSLENLIHALQILNAEWSRADKQKEISSAIRESAG